MNETVSFMTFDHTLKIKKIQTEYFFQFEWNRNESLGFLTKEQVEIKRKKNKIQIKTVSTNSHFEKMYSNLFGS